MSCGCFILFVFKQKTAYEMRISDWSSDVCSSDLRPERRSRDRARPGVVELLREHMRVNIEPDHRFMLAGDRVGKAAERRVELIIVDDVAADQHIAALDQFRESGAHLEIGRAHV